MKMDEILMNMLDIISYEYNPEQKLSSSLTLIIILPWCFEMVSSFPAGQTPLLLLAGCTQKPSELECVCCGRTTLRYRASTNSGISAASEPLKSCEVLDDNPGCVSSIGHTTVTVLTCKNDMFRLEFRCAWRQAFRQMSKRESDPARVI